jgi:hypothetical protein
MSDTEKKKALISPKARLSYPQLFRAKPGPDGGEPKFSATLIFDEEAQKTPEFKALKDAAAAADAPHVIEGKAVEVAQ